LSIRLAGANATPLAIAEANLAETKEEDGDKEEKKPRLLERFDLKGRIKKAYETCEIKLSNEVIDALEGFYTDHYELADMIGIACGDSIEAEDLIKILEREDGIVEGQYFDKFIESYQYLSFPSPPSAESAVRILAYLKSKELLAQDEEEKKQINDQLLRCASSCLENLLFQETSLGISTLEEGDTQLIAQLFERIVEASEGTSARPTHSHHDGPSIEWPVNGNKMFHRLTASKYILANIKDKITRFWDDCRMAGQLEIHNTGHLPLIAQRGNILLPRTEQHRRYGTMHVQTAVNDNMHSVVPHFSERLDTGTGYKIAGTHPQYKTEGNDKGSGTILVPLADIVRVAPFARDAHYAVVEQKDPEKKLVNSPSPHNPTSIGAGEPDEEGMRGNDRVFFSSSRVAEAPDSFEIKLRSTSTLLFICDDIKDSYGYGQGEGFPIIDTALTPGEASHKVHEAQQRALEQPIYKDKIVVPLRRNVFDFVPENAPRRFNSSGRKAPSYNANPLLTA
jgi:hypothetical protein